MEARSSRIWAPLVALAGTAAQRKRPSLDHVFVAVAAQGTVPSSLPSRSYAVDPTRKGAPYGDCIQPAPGEV